MSQDNGWRRYTVRYYHYKSNGCVDFWGENREYGSKRAAIRDAQSYLAKYPERHEWAEVTEHKLVAILQPESTITNRRAQ
jgi:hypothetical protein